MNIYVKQLDPAAILPSYANQGDAGADLYATEHVVIGPGERVSIGTGIAIAIPDGYAGLVLPRSGNARKYGITLANSPGLIDAGYRGEIRCTMINHGKEPYYISLGDRIAQLVIVPFMAGTWLWSDSLSGSVRGDAGFGSSGR